jgi:hypothetical protein
VKIKPLVFSLLSGMLISPFALAAGDQEADALLNKINARTQALEKQVQELQGQLRVLKHKQGKLNISRRHLAEKVDTETINSTAELELHGTPVVTSPYFGVESQYDGSSLIVSMSSINQDLSLLQQWQKLESKMRADGKPFPEKSLVELSGKIEAQANYAKPYVGKDSSDINLSGLELDIAAGINRWTTGFMAINYDDNPLSTEASRTNNSKLFVNKAFVNVCNVHQSMVSLFTYSSFFAS